MSLRTIARLIAGLGLVACAAGSQAVGYTGLVVFGDGLSDSGNVSLSIGADPGQQISGNQYVAERPYASGTFSNGQAWSQQLATRLGLTAAPSLAGGSNYAFGGARLDRMGAGDPPSLPAQLGLFLNAHGGQADADALYVVSGGSQDISLAMQQVLGGADPQVTAAELAARYANTMGAMVDGLQAAGAKRIVVWNAPNLGLTPLVGSFGPAVAELVTGLALGINAALDQRLAGEAAGVSRFDVFGLLGATVANPSHYGFDNVNQACGAAVLGCDPATALFYDGVHPTARAHRMLAESLYASAVPEPATTALWMLGLAGVATGVNRRKKTPTP